MEIFTNILPRPANCSSLQTCPEKVTGKCNYIYFRFRLLTNSYSDAFYHSEVLNQLNLSTRYRSCIIVHSSCLLDFVYKQGMHKQSDCSEFFFVLWPVIFFCLKQQWTVIFLSPPSSPQNAATLSSPILISEAPFAKLLRSLIINFVGLKPQVINHRIQDDKWLNSRSC